MEDFGTIHPLLKNFDNSPFSEFMGLKLMETGGGKAVSIMTVTDQLLNPVNYFHGGLLYAASDVTAFAALLSVLDAEQAAVTVDIQVSMLRPAVPGDTITLKAEVIKHGRSLAFVETRSFIADKLIATTKVTKSVSKFK